MHASEPAGAAPPGIPDTIRAYVAERDGDEVVAGVRDLPISELGPGEVTIRVAWSSVNYKDGLAAKPDGRVAGISPLVLGVDLSGKVIASDDPRVPVGAEVIVHGNDVGVSHHGGFATHARVPGDWVVPLPEGMTLREAMELGTAGFTAALSVAALEEHGLGKGDGPVLVTGATGGVGSTAVGILAARGYEVVALTGKPQAAQWLRDRGASDVVGRDVVGADARGALGPQRWAAAVDCVGGDVLVWILRTLRYGGAVAASGLTAGSALRATVFPFILRGVALLGIDAVQTPMARRAEIWERLAGDLRPTPPADGTFEVIGLDGITDVLSKILAGAARGRWLVDPEG